MRYGSFVLSLLAVVGLAFAGLAGVVAQEATPEPTGMPTAPDAMFTETFDLPELQVTLTDNGYEVVPDETQEGWHLVTFTNNIAPTGDPAEDAWAAEFVLLPEGMTAADFDAQLGEEPEGETATPEAMVDGATPAVAPEDPFAFLYETHLAGGPGAAPGQTVQGIVFLEAGDYAVSAFGEFPSAELTVSGDSMASPVVDGTPAPLGITADATITEVGTSPDFDFEVSGPISPGAGVLEIFNDSDQPHFIFAFRSPEPITEDQVMLLFESFETGTPVAGAPDPSQISLGFLTGTQSAGTTQYLAVDLEPGYYVLLCFIPDPEQEGIPHAFEGMIEIVPVGVEDGATPAA